MLVIRENKANLRVNNLRSKQREQTGGGSYQNRTSAKERGGGKSKFWSGCDNVMIEFPPEQKTERKRRKAETDRERKRKRASSKERKRESEGERNV